VNPFDLPGPWFLLFYAVLCLLVNAVVSWLRRLGEPGNGPLLRPEDPYLVSYLRGGALEALQVATMSLIDRGLLTVEGADESRLVTAGPQAVELVQRPIEKLILHEFQQPGEAKHLTHLQARGCEGYARTLEQAGLLPDRPARSRRWLLGVVAAGVLAGVALLKILIALSRGRTNIGFLLVLAVLFCWLSYRWATPRLTARGERFLEDLHTLFSGLKGRAAGLRPGGDTSELAWLAAVFGATAVPFPFPSLFRQQPAESSTSWGFGGSSCGSGCGGGGGGGCGGCGG